MWAFRSVHDEAADARPQGTSERTLSSLPLRLRTMSKSPSPLTLLISWVMLAIAVAAYCGSHPGGRYRSFLIVGSAFVALLVGIAEQSSLNTIILTDIPWCVTLGILMDKLFRLCRGMLWERQVEVGRQPGEQLGRDMEKNSVVCCGFV
jgi:hypothetical protein